MIRVLTYDQIDFAEWQALVASCQTGTWFQSPEAYEFYASLPEVMEHFVLGVQNTEYRPDLALVCGTIDNSDYIAHRAAQADQGGI